MEFKEFDKYVLKYCPLNKQNNRFLIEFKNKTFAIYTYKKKDNILIRIL
jgi:hypothetical protein